MRSAAWSLLMFGGAALAASPDGTCGGANGYSCWGSFFGNCCGVDGRCGSTPDVCGSGCQTKFGFCQESWWHKRDVASATGSVGGDDDEDDDDYCGCDDEDEPTSSSVIPSSSALPSSSFPSFSANSSVPYPTGTGSSSIPYPTGGSSSVPYPTGTGASSIPVGPTGTGSVSSRPVGTGSVSTRPSGTGSVSSRPTGTGTGTIGTTSTSSTCSSTPKPTADGWVPGCIPCEGQPGLDKFCGYTVNDDNYKVIPKTCKVVYYEWDITEEQVAPDGISRMAMLVGGSLPGPDLKASWGDTVVVKINNKLTTNGTSIHFHGLRQSNNSANDGVPSITQCPVAPGESYTYQWVAENYGSSWYHSHYAIQAWEGVFGSITIDGPHSAEFDEDLGHVVLQDWSHFTVDSRYDLAQNATVDPSTNQTYGGPVVMDTGLINGKNVWGDDGSASQTGERSVFTFTPGNKHLLRIVNTAIQSTYKFYIDGHTMTVISADFVPIVPYKTNILNINIGQRYNVIVEADQSVGDYWMRSDNQQSCAGTVQAKNIKAIVRYDAGSTAAPTSTAYDYTDECIDEPMASLVPVAPLDAAAQDSTVLGGPINVVVAGNEVSLFKWYLGGTTFFSEYKDPTLLSISQNGTTPDYSGNLLIKNPDANKMVYIIVESPIPLPHPLHLHGHDFWILAEGKGTYSSSTPLNLQNPPRRDTALMPAAGFIVIGFVTDNPGVWLMHCHIGWHTSMGFALQFVEQEDKIKKTIKDTCELNDNCATWDTWANANGLSTPHDSGV